jgi:hypothetical protein
MPPNSTPATTATQIEKRLAELQLRLRIPMVGRRIREELFSESERKQIEVESKPREEAERKRIEAEGKTLTEEERTPIEAEVLARLDVIGFWSRFKNVSRGRAIADLAFATDLLSPGQHARLLRDLKESAPDRVVPEWNRESCKLNYGAKLARKIRGLTIAKRIVTILDAFERAGWPERIANPLADKDAQRLREAIARLNRGLSLINFSADGASCGIRWEPVTGRAPAAHEP